jgi:FkbM family methyltransferase
VGLARSAWTAIPEGKVKQWLRLVINNYRQRGTAHFRSENGVYIAETAGFKVSSAAPLFDLRRIMQQFESRYTVSAGETVVDAGAFHGLLTIVFAAQVGPSGRVLSFEPDSINCERVLRNLLLNGSPAHVELIPQGLWNCEAEIEFCERGALGSSAFWDGPGGRKVQIQVTTLDRVVLERKLTRLDFVKMNIEGAEIKALEGAAETIRRFKPHFAISSNHFVDGNIAAGVRTCGVIEKLLSQHGYTVETAEFGSEWVTYGIPNR